MELSMHPEMPITLAGVTIVSTILQKLSDGSFGGANYKFTNFPSAIAHSCSCMNF